MTNFKMTNFSIESFDKNNKEHLIYLKELMNDDTVKERFTGLSFKLHLETDIFLFDRGYFISDNDDNLVAYYHFGAKNKDDEVYLRSTTRMSFRGKGYGSKILAEVSEFIFENFNDVSKIILKIDRDNLSSWKVASNALFEWFNNDYCAKTNVNYVGERKNKL